MSIGSDEPLPAPGQVADEMREATTRLRDQARRWLVAPLTTLILSQQPEDADTA